MTSTDRNTQLFSTTTAGGVIVTTTSSLRGGAEGRYRTHVIVGSRSVTWWWSGPANQIETFHGDLHSHPLGATPPREGPPADHVGQS